MTTLDTMEVDPLPVTEEMVELEKTLRAMRLKMSQAIKILTGMNNPQTESETISQGPSPETPEAPQGKETPKLRPKPSDHPAIQAYRDVFHTYPQRGAYQLIVEAVGDKHAELELWRECCTYWMSNGWNPKNIGGQLERFNQEWLDSGPGTSYEEVIDGVLYNVYQDGSRELAD